MSYLHLYGVPLVYDDEGAGPPVILLGATAADWPEARPPGFRYLVPDLPGRGRTEGVPLSPEEEAEFVVGLIMMLNLRGYRVLVRGHGARVGAVLKERMGLDEVCPAPDAAALWRCLAGSP